MRLRLSRTLVETEASSLIRFAGVIHRPRLLGHDGDEGSELSVVEGLGARFSLR